MSDNKETYKSGSFKSRKMKIKAARTIQLNKLVGRVAGVSSSIEPRSLEEMEGNNKSYYGVFGNIKDKTFKILEELQTLYQEQKHIQRQIKVGDKVDELIEGEAQALLIMTTITRSVHPVNPPSYSSNSNNSLPHRNGDTGLNNLERIHIPTFIYSRHKAEFQLKMLRLEACLASQALETSKGLINDILKPLMRLS